MVGIAGVCLAFAGVQGIALQRYNAVFSGTANTGLCSGMGRSGCTRNSKR